jgi:hypothetical protein
MKRILFTLLIFVFAQNVIGQGINFQGVARSANGTILASQKISLKLSIITGVSTNTPDYIETRSVETNTQGIFSIVVGDIGALTTIGAYANINWKNNIKFLKVEMDPNNGTNFISMGTTQLQYVPFSYYSNGVDAANISGVLPVKSGGTGFTSLSDLKAAINKSESSTFLNRINFTDEDANDHIAKYDTGYNSPLIYSRYFYGHYGDLILQGMSKTYTGNIHFVTGSNIAGYDPPTQRMVIMDNGNVGIGDFVSSAPTSKLQVSGIVSATGYKVPGGLSTQYLRADGTVTTSVTAGVPYTGASQATDLGSFDMKVNGVSIGIGSGNSSATTNLILGNNALKNNTSGSYNLGVGGNTLYNNTTGYQNNAFGNTALYSNTTGTLNSAFGDASMYYNTTGSFNTAYGAFSLYSNKANSGSLAIGYDAMRYADDRTTGVSTFNTAIGIGALRGSSTASNNIGVANTAVGYESMKLNSSGSRNATFGDASMGRNSTGSDNVAFGRYGLYNNTVGNYNISIGTQALYNNVGNTGSVAIGFNSMFYADNRSTGRTTGNTAIGYEALKGSTTAANNTGQNNTALGYQTLIKNTSGGQNVGLGAESLYENTIGSGNIALGYKALFFNISGSNNIGIGNAALYSGGNHNVAIGQASSYYNNGDFNVSIGAMSLYGNLTGENNTAIGPYSMKFNSIGNNNTSLGFNSLLNHTTGSNNLALGYNSGLTLTTGTGNTLIGTNSNVLSGNISNSTALGYNAQVTASNQIQLGDANVTDVKTSGNVTAKKFTSIIANAYNFSTGTNNVDLSLSNIYTINLSGNITLTFSNGTPGTYIIKLIQDGTGSRIATFPVSNWKWAGGNIPTLSTVANTTDIVSLIFDGTTYYATIVKGF